MTVPDTLPDVSAGPEVIEYTKASLYFLVLIDAGARYSGGCFWLGLWATYCGNINVRIT